MSKKSEVYFRVAMKEHANGSLWMEYHVNRDRQAVVEMKALSKGVRVDEGTTLTPHQIASNIDNWLAEAAVLGLVMVY